MDDTRVLISGSDWFVRWHAIYGEWKIEQSDDGLFFRTGADFRTIAGPDVQIYLSKLGENSIDKYTQLHDPEVGLFVAPVATFAGESIYMLPEGVSLSEYRTLVLHCKSFSAVWGGINIG